MSKETSIDIEKLNEHIESKKDAFRRHQRDLPFGEKMKISFALAKRDETIRRAILLPKNKIKKKD